ncbi:hypothetical protein DXG03_003974 [Asterophora parasitica]|uniref:Uncharacterized protein n=1 Tax=Asterophora parasitica TaxID=117018 RepID=A0A9P7G7J0_9AGAR|nr:hypothetical protein DXG03_003974 [Asterophora parasitica]
MASSSFSHNWESQPQQWHGDSPAYVSTGKLEAALNRASQKAVEYEYQMKELEVRLSESLSNFRAIDSLIQESYNGLQRHTRRAERACQTQVPHINSELDESLKILSDLADTLPTIQSQLADVRVVYDSGRDKVRHHGTFLFHILA